MSSSIPSRPKRVVPVSEPAGAVLESASTAATVSPLCRALSVQSLELGSSNRAWASEDLVRAFEHLGTAVWVHRAVAEPCGPRCCLYANSAAAALAGSCLPPVACLAVAQNATPRGRAQDSSIRQTYVDKVQGSLQAVRVTAGLLPYLSPLFSCPPQGHAELQHQPILVEMEGTPNPLPAVLSHIVRLVNPDELRSTAVADATPLHRFLFDEHGCLLFANSRAVKKWRQSGYPDLGLFTLADLIRINGHRQPAVAQEALQAIFANKQRFYSITLSDVLPNGQMRHTAYKAVPAADPAEDNAPAMMVSTIDVTSEKETELELRRLRTALQQQNMRLQEEMRRASDGKAEAEAGQARLQQQLREALQLHQLPEAHVQDTASPVNQILLLVDDLLDGTMPTTQRLMSIRNLLLSSSDLRSPSNLERQFRNATGILADTAKGLTSLLQSRNKDAVKLLLERLHPALRKCPRPQALSAEQTNGKIEGGSGPIELSDHGSLLAISMPVIPEADRLLQDATENWSFDVFELDTATQGHCLSYLGYFLFKQHDLLSKVQINELAFASFLRQIEAGYRNSNPYHNRLHAACVLHHTSLLIFAKGGLYALALVEHLLAAAMLLAAICHDYDHPGVNNDFLIRTLSPLAIRYNDCRVLENHHCAAAFEIMIEDDELFQFKASSADRVALRAAICDLILATDMKQHFLLLSILQNALQSGKFEAVGNNQVSSSGDLDAPYDLTPELRLNIMQCALKCADLGHLALPNELHRKWTGRILEEFYRQGDLERSMGMEISVLMDRSRDEHTTGSQIGFFEVVALPLFKSMQQVLPAAGHLLAGASDNYMRWRSGEASPIDYKD